jgi:hypothetical protein
VVSTLNFTSEQLLLGHLALPPGGHSRQIATAAKWPLPLHNLSCADSWLWNERMKGHVSQHETKTAKEPVLKHQG